MKLTRRGARVVAIIAVAGLPLLGNTVASGAAAAVATSHGVPKILTPTLRHEPGAFSLNAVTCVSAAHCVAVGEASGTVTGGVLVPITNGALGTPVYADDVDSEFLSVSCVSATQCVMVGDTTAGDPTPGPDQAGVWEYVGGEITQLALTDPTNATSRLTGVDCQTASHCVTVGSATHDFDSNPASPVGMFGSVSLTSSPSAAVTDNEVAGQALSVTCPTSALCYGGGSTVAGKAEALRIHGSTITGVLQSGITEVDSIACVAVASCVATGQKPGGLLGTGWAEHLNSDLKGTPRSVATTALLPGIADLYSGYYLAAGYTTNSVWTVDLVTAAGTPRPVQNLNLEGVAQDVTCPTQTECLVVGRASDADPDQPGGSSGTDGALAVIHLRTVPTAPRVTVRSAAHTSETIRITAPSNNGGATVASYRLTVDRCRPHHAACHLELVKSLTVKPSKPTVRVTGLLAHTTYYFSATATNAIGASPASARVHKKTS